MIYVKRDFSDADLLLIIKSWIDVLKEKRYQCFIEALGYSLGNGEPKAGWIISDLKRYRSDLFSEVEHFEITDWRTAIGGNKNPKAEVIRYEPNETGLVGAVSFDLPLNGRWSDLTADFVLLETDYPEGYLLRFEEITVNNQPIKTG